MSTSWSPEHIALVHDDVRRLVQRSADHHAQLPALVGAAEGRCTGRAASLVARDLGVRRSSEE